MTTSSVIGEIGYCPTQAQWDARHHKFRSLEGIWLGESGFTQHSQVLPMTYELEHAFCSGAWISVILLAQLLVDIYFNDQNLASHAKRLERYGDQPIWPELERLRLRRNALVHRTPDQRAVFSFDDQWSMRDMLYEEAKRAVALAFRFTLEPSRDGDSGA